MSSPSPSIHRLPDVLTQLVMQSLSLRELLQFARCNRRLLTQADSAFAFKHVPPLTRSWCVRALKSPRLSLGQPVRKIWTRGSPHQSLPPLVKLLRHVPVTLQPTVGDACLNELLAELPSQFHAFDTTSVALSLPDCLQLLAHPSMQSIKHIIVNNGDQWASRDVLEAVARLPLLHTVTMIDVQGGRPSVEPLRLLSAIPHLTSIALDDTDFAPGSILAGLVNFPSLKHLTVRRPWLYDDEWVAHFASPGLSQLTSLTLDWCIFANPSQCPPLNPEHAATVFSSLKQLTSLQLTMPFGVDKILPSLHFACPTLTTLRIEASCDPDDTCAREVLPSFAVLLPLMIAQPQLRIEIDLRDHESPLRDEYVPKLAADFAAVSADVRNRLTVLH